MMQVTISRACPPPPPAREGGVPSCRDADARGSVAGGPRAGGKPVAGAGADPCGQGVQRRSPHRQGWRHARVGGVPGSARPGSPLGVTRRPETRPRSAPFRPVAGCPRLSRHRRLHRRLHRCAAGAWRGEGALGRRRPRPACLETAGRSARRGAREDQRPLFDPRRHHRSDRRRSCATRALSA